MLNGNEKQYYSFHLFFHFGYAFLWKSTSIHHTSKEVKFIFNFSLVFTTKMIYHEITIFALMLVQNKTHDISKQHNTSPTIDFKFKLLNHFIVDLILERWIQYIWQPDIAVVKVPKFKALSFNLFLLLYPLIWIEGKVFSWEIIHMRLDKNISRFLCKFFRYQHQIYISRRKSIIAFVFIKTINIIKIILSNLLTWLIYFYSFSLSLCSESKRLSKFILNWKNLA